MKTETETVSPFEGSDAVPSHKVRNYVDGSWYRRGVLAEYVWDGTTYPDMEVPASMPTHHVLGREFACTVTTHVGSEESTLIAEDSDYSICEVEVCGKIMVGIDYVEAARLLLDSPTLENPTFETVNTEDFSGVLVGEAFYEIRVNYVPLTLRVEVSEDTEVEAWSLKMPYILDRAALVAGLRDDCVDWAEFELSSEEYTRLLKEGCGAQ